MEGEPGQLDTNLGAKPEGKEGDPNPVEEILETPEKKLAREKFQQEQTQKLETAERADKESSSTELATLQQSVESTLEAEQQDGKKSYYEILGVSPNDPKEKIAAAYRKIAKESHPDLHPGDKLATAKFKEAAQAFEILNDEDKRGEYDKYLRALETPVELADNDAETSTEYGSDLSPSLGSEKFSPLVPISREERMNAVVIRAEQKAMVEYMGLSNLRELATVQKEFKESGNSLANFVASVEFRTGELKDLTGDINKDSGKIEKFFGDYGIKVEPNAVESIGKSLYKAAVEGKKKKEGSLLKALMKVFEKTREGFRKDRQR